MDGEFRTYMQTLSFPTDFNATQQIFSLYQNW